MANSLSLALTKLIETELPNLRALTDDRAAIPRAPGKWSAKEELGHLIDSAANNHIRFVRGALEPTPRDHGYRQDEWVRLHNYAGMPWNTVVDFWFQYNSLLAGLVGNIPDDRLETIYTIGLQPGVTVRFLIDDYILHMQHHIDQLLKRPVVTPYPRATPAR